MALSGLLAVTAVAGLSGAASAKTTKHFKGTIVGASVSSNENVYDLRGAGVHGAAIQTFKTNSTGTGGTDRITIYYGNGTTVSSGTYTNTLPDANGVVTVTDTGHFIRGTGAYKDIRGHYKFTGTLDTKTGRLKGTLSVAETF